MHNREMSLALDKVGVLKYASREVRYGKSKSKRHNDELRAAGLR